MASSKRYYWLKLKTDFFDDDKINWLEEQENGKDYIILYLKLCLKTVNTNGILIRRIGELIIPYDLKKISEITRTDIDKVRVAIELFKKIGLINIYDDGSFFIEQFNEMIGSESTSASRVRKHRQKMLQSNNDVTIKKLPSNEDIDIR